MESLSVYSTNKQGIFFHGVFLDLFFGRNWFMIVKILYMVNVFKLYISVPKMEFLHADYEVLETEGQIVAIVTRSGDINQRSKVRCYTRQSSAEVMVDYVERPDTNASFVEFSPGKTSFTIQSHAVLLIACASKMLFRCKCSTFEHYFTNYILMYAHFAINLYSGHLPSMLTI